MSPLERNLLFVILALAAGLRFLGLSEQGIVHYDEAAHLLEARFVRESLTRTSPGAGAAMDVVATVPGLPLFHAKPLHAGLIAITQTLLGDHADTGSRLMALFGVATTALVYFFTRRFFGGIAGLLAALFHAVDPWTVLYGRLALPEADSTFFAFFGFTVLVSGARARLRVPLAALLLGAAVLCNYRWLLLLPLAAGALAFLRARIEEERTRLAAFVPAIGATLVTLGAMAAMILFTDALYGQFVLGARLDALIRPRTYLEDLIHNVDKFRGLGVGTALRDPLRFPYLVWHFGGLLGIAVVGAGGAAALRLLRSDVRDSGARRSRFGAASVAALVLLPPLVLLFSACSFPRCLSIAQAPAAVLAGLGLLSLTSRFTFPRGFGLGQRAGLAGGVLLLLQLGRAPLYTLRSGYEEAAGWLRSHGASSCVASQPYALRVHGISAAGLPPTHEALVTLHTRGTRYLLVDNQVWTGGQGATYRALRETMKPIATLEHPAGQSASFAWESPEATFAATRARERGSDWIAPSRILIYDLDQLPR